MRNRETSMEIDLEHLMTMTGGDVSLAEEVLDIFKTQADVWGRMLDPGLEHQQWADAAHTIKGAALSIGAKDLAETCLTAENLGRSGLCKLTEASVALNDVKSALAQALEACARASHALSKPGLRLSKDLNS